MSLVDNVVKSTDSGAQYFSVCAKKRRGCLFILVSEKLFKAVLLVNLHSPSKFLAVHKKVRNVNHGCLRDTSFKKDKT